MADTYANFAALAASEAEGKDFRIAVREGRTGIVIIAPHGGKIEAHTSAIAMAIAAADHALYLFEGSAAQNNRRLHVTSENFDEPRGRDIVVRSMLAIGVHGARGNEDFVIVGGLNGSAKTLMLTALAHFGATDIGPKHLLGNSTANICNRAKEAGVQLEISQGLRNKLCGANQRLASPRVYSLMRDFAESVRQASTEYQAVRLKDVQ